MKFGMLYSLQLPRPWTPGKEHRVVQEALSQIELADRLGYDNIWNVEHHFLEEYSHSSAPEVFLAAASQRTKNIRLGHGIIQMTTNHPARVAERVAMLDLVSNGRVELGMGEGGNDTELGPFNVPLEQKRAIWEDAVRAVVPSFTNEVWEYDGPYFKFPRRVIVPKVFQNPHPPLWVACRQLETIVYAGRIGMGALCFRFNDLEATNAWVQAYYHAFTTELKTLVDYPINPNVAIFLGFMCAETEAKAKKMAEGWDFWQFCLLYSYTSGPRAPGSVNMWDLYKEWKRSPDGQKEFKGALIGTPAQIREQLLQYEALHVDQIVFISQAGNTRHEDVCSSLELFAREVMPEFHDRHAKQDEWKRRVISGEIKIAPVDVTPYNTAKEQSVEARLGIADS